MKSRFILIASIALAACTLSSCKDKNLPKIDKLTDPATFVEEAKALLPSAGLRDSLAYSIGTNLGAEINYSGEVGFGDLSYDRMLKGLSDFGKVSFDDFNAAAGTNFTDSLGLELVKNFEVSPAVIGDAVNHIIAARKSAEDAKENPEVTVTEVTPELADSVAYLFGVLIGYRINEFPDLPTDRLFKGIKDFREADKDRTFRALQMAETQDQEAIDAFNAKLELTPESVQELAGRFMEAVQAATVKNVEVQSKLFVEKAENVKGMIKLPVTYQLADGKDTTSFILYRYLTEGKGTPVAFGDTFKVTYKGTHVDNEVFDEGDFPVENFSEDTRLIRGFVEALKLIKEGDNIQVIIPGDLAYGKQGNYNPWTRTYTIYPDETLIFELSVSDIVKPQPKAEEPAAPAEEPVAEPAEPAAAE